jgi:hypothetical protein
VILPRSSRLQGAGRRGDARSSRHLRRWLQGRDAAVAEAAERARRFGAKVVALSVEEGLPRSAAATAVGGTSAR